MARTKKASRTMLLTRKEAKQVSRAYHQVDINLCTMMQWLARISEDFPQLTDKAKSAKTMLVYARYTCCDEFRKLFFAAERYRDHENRISELMKRIRGHKRAIKGNSHSDEFKETMKGWVEDCEKQIQECGEELKKIYAEMLSDNDE